MPEEFIPEKLVTFDEVISISAKKQMNTGYLKDSLRHWLDIDAELQQNLVSEKTLLPLPESSRTPSTIKSRRWKRLPPEEQTEQKMKEHFDGGHYV